MAETREPLKFLSRAGVGIPATAEISHRPEPIRNLLARFTRGVPDYEYVDPSIPTSTGALPFASISLPFPGNNRSGLFFARVVPPRGTTPRPGPSEAAKKVETYSVRSVAGDGRCMFRALVQGMASNRGQILTSREEEAEADMLRMAVVDALCRGEERRSKYEEALIAITLDESLPSYCRRVVNPSFWGGESELLVLSRMCSQPIIVYVPEAVAKRGAKWSSGYVPIQEYGTEYTKATKERKGRKPVRLLFNGTNHYDLLL